MWFENAVLYQIYPLGMLDALYPNDGVLQHRLPALEGWIPWLRGLGVDTLLFNPLFSSNYHGYDTRDFLRIDERLGDWQDFQSLCAKLKDAGFRVMLDAVYNHVGREFWAFRDVLEKREASPYRDWFQLDFSRNSPFNDGFAYKDWEGHAGLVALNLRHPELKRYLLEATGRWIDDFGLDGLRLDVAYMIDRDFLRELYHFCKKRRPQFFIFGEMIHGDYRQLVQAGVCDSCTNYEAHKSLWSSFNTGNLFEIGHNLQRCFGPENWCLYRDKKLISFADNHDVTRIASQINDKELLPVLYALLLGMPGIPCLYYGSEWAAEGDKNCGDEALRRPFAHPIEHELGHALRTMIHAYKELPALAGGDFRILHQSNQQLIFERRLKDGGERTLVAVNIDAKEATIHFDAGCGRAENLLRPDGAGGYVMVDFGGGVRLAPKSAAFWRMER